MERGQLLNFTYLQKKIKEVYSSSSSGYINLLATDSSPSFFPSFPVLKILIGLRDQKDESVPLSKVETKHLGGLEKREYLLQ